VCVCACVSVCVCECVSGRVVDRHERDRVAVAHVVPLRERLEARRDAEAHGGAVARVQHDPLRAGLELGRAPDVDAEERFALGVP
jgi:hypothetical protein